MAILPILFFDNPVLRQKAKRVPVIDDSIQRLIDDMIETMRAAPAGGLAAPQVGVPLRVIVVVLPGEEPFALINPEVVRKSGEREVMEACLCLPRYAGEIKRSAKVTVKGLDRRGREVRIRGEELMAQALEHEIDHLNGILYIDHLESMEKLFKVEAGAEPPEI
ncbi:MAG: peptide deformylase [Dehalococcoidia bacterium]|nr:MAG: peptide deformylase [Dehalococcoidia bacterium]